jgi:hypothetical protein
MTRRDGRQEPWTKADRAFLADNAGRLTKRQIADTLDKSEEAVKCMARRLGLSLRCSPSRTRICPSCGMERSRFGRKTGICRVCELEVQLSAAECRFSNVMALLTPAERERYMATESLRESRVDPKPQPHPGQTGEERAIELEAWECGNLQRKVDAARTRLKNARAKVSSEDSVNAKSSDPFSKEEK